MALSHTRSIWSAVSRKNMRKEDREGLVNQLDRKTGTALRNVIKVKNRGGGGHLKEQYSKTVLFYQHYCDHLKINLFQEHLNSLFALIEVY